jgi:cyclophilin family peptidyl-prolyl cis-trans isomerase
LEVIQVQYKTLLASGLALAAMLATIGCGQKSSENQPAASIGGENAASTKAKDLSSEQSIFDMKHPQVIIETSLGSITIQLNREKSPITVDNFLAYAESGLYNKTIFHQVYKNQYVFAGVYTMNLTEIRTRPQIRNEADNGLKNLRGTIAMYRQTDVIDSATSQFFINVADNQALDQHTRNLEDPQGYGYCVFGEVTSGMKDVVDNIASTPVQDTKEFVQAPLQAVVIKSIRRVK